MDTRTELEILCEVPLKVHVGDEEIEVYPPTLAKLQAASEHWTNLLNKAMNLGESADKPKGEKTGKDEPGLDIVLDQVYGLIEDVLPLVNIFLAPRGKVESKFTLDQLRSGLDVRDIRRILTFARESLQLGELMTGALTPFMLPEIPETAKLAGQK